MLKDKKEKKPIKIGTLFEAESKTKLVNSSVPQSIWEEAEGELEIWGVLNPYYAKRTLR